jgi:hypothetical protein
MKVYRPFGIYHYLTLCLIPIGAWRTARHGGSRVAYFLYGAACTSLVSLEPAHALPFWGSDSQFFTRGVVVVAFPIVTGLCCNLVTWFRSDFLDLDRMPEGVCQCGYDLTGNVSGRCPECGTVIPRGADITAVESAVPNVS